MDDIVYMAAIVIGVVLVAMLVNKRLLTLLLSSVFMLLVAVRLSIPSMYLMGSVLLALPLASYFIGRYAARRLSIDLRAPESITVGETGRITVDVLSPQAIFSSLAQAECVLPDALQAVPGSESVVPIPGGLRREFNVLAVRRGILDLTGDAVAVSDPLGIFTITRRLVQPRRIVVYPDGLSGEVPLQLGYTSSGWMLETSTGRRGDSEGFYGTREYRTGDDIRRIHWRSSARHGSLVIAERETSASAVVWICLDLEHDPDSDTEEPLEQAVRTAVTVLDNSLRNGHSVGLLASGEPVIRILPQAREAQRWRILEALAGSTANSGSFVDCLKNENSFGSHASLVIITPNPTSWLQDAVSDMATAGLRTSVVHIESEPGDTVNRILRSMSAVAGTFVVRVPERKGTAPGAGIL